MSEQLPAPLQLVCRLAGVSRSAACEQRRRRGTSEPRRRRPGPLGALGDCELLAEIRDVLIANGLRLGHPGFSGWVTTAPSTGSLSGPAGAFKVVLRLPSAWMVLQPARRSR